MGKYSTVKIWCIEPSKVDDIQITLQDGDIEVRYQLPMEEAMMVVAAVKKLRRQVPTETYFQVNFGGKQHGFEGNVQDLIRDLQTEINECMARRVMGSQAFRRIMAEELPKDEVITPGVIVPAIDPDIPPGFNVVPHSMGGVCPEGIDEEPVGVPKPKGTKKK